MITENYNRRDVLKIYGLSGLGLMAYPILFSFIDKEQILERPIPSSNQLLPVVGLGTWQTFDVGSSVSERKVLIEVLSKMNNYGGRVIDSSPMYGSSEGVVGDLTFGADFTKDFFYATKVWTTGKEAGIHQMENSLKLMKRQQMDLMQIHNLLDWRTHLKTLKSWKEKGKIKYWGITHYTDAAHSDLEAVIKSERPDFVQFNYSILSRHAEKSLFDVIRKHRTAVLINRPFEGGNLFRMVKGKPLPVWARDFNITSWGQYFLKFILSNELVTCIIPGTSKPYHMTDNMMAGYGHMPDEHTRESMVSYLKKM